MLCFSSAPRYFIQVTESLIFKNLEIIRFCAKLRVHKRFRIQFILLQYYLLYTVQAVSREITQISIENHPDSLRKVIQSLKFRKLRCAQEISSCFICFTQQMKVVINCGKSDILKGKQVPVVSLVKRFSNKFFQCLRSSPPASTRSLQLPFVLSCHGLK